EPEDVVLQGDGRIVVAGQALYRGHLRLAIARFVRAGRLDPTFGEDGKIHRAIGDSAGAASVAIQPDGRIVAAGRAQFGSSARFAVARFEPDGSPDATFSDDGIVSTRIGGTAAAADLALQVDGKLVVAGGARIQGTYRFAVARFVVR